MANPFSNKKKVRGLKRHVRKIEQLKASHLKLDLEDLEASGRTYMKLYLSPWSNLVKRNPPFWYRRRVLQAMIDVHQSWREQLLQRGEPFYLKVWLFHPQFWNTQVVAAVGDSLGFYDNSFERDETPDVGTLLAYDAPSTPVYRLSWEAHVDTAYLFEDFHIQSPAELEWAERRAYAVTRTDAGERMFHVRQGTVWVGDVSPR